MSVTLLATILMVFTMAFGAPVTPQEMDRIIFNAVQSSLIDCAPLESWEGIKAFNLMNKPHKVSSGNWRGYRATWEIRNDRLYLVDIESYVCPNDAGDCERATLQKLFGDRCVNGAVAADWFTGEVRIAVGEPKSYRCIIESVYDKEIVLDVRQGEVVATRKVDNRKLYRHYCFKGRR